jgi:hypothetical protein
VKIRIKAALAGSAVLAVTAGILAVGGGAAQAAVTVPYEPDNDALGTISFFDNGGHQVTGGSLSDHPTAFYSVASGPGRAGDTKAQLRAYTPQEGVLPALWTGDTLTATTDYPPTGAPANISAMNLPVATATAGDFSLADYISELPNTATDAYANLYELRLYTAGAGQGAGSTYYRVDIQVNVTGQDSFGEPTGTWSLVFPVQTVVTATSTTLSVNPPSSANLGTAVTLTAHVSPAGAAGSVDFTDGATDLGSGTYDAASGTASLTVSTLGEGDHSLKATFAPTDPAAFTGSASAAQSYRITNLTPTQTTLSASPANQVVVGADGNATVTLTVHVTPAGVPGGVEFFNGSTDLGGADSYTAATGVATKALTLQAGAFGFSAAFTPTDGTHGVSATQGALSYAVLPPNFGTANIPLSALDNTAPYAGNLALQVGANAAVSLTQVDPNTTAGHPVISTDPTGHRHAWVFNGSLSGVSVVDTRPTENGWTLTGQLGNFAGPSTFDSSNVGWSPALASGGDAEGAANIVAGTAINPHLETVGSNGIVAGSKLASAPTGSGLGTQNLSAGVSLWIPDTSASGSYTSTLTLTLVSP